MMKLTHVDDTERKWHEVIAPTVHLNGTSGSELEAGYELAATKLHEAIQALDACSPNGRDYYVQEEPGGESNAYGRARLEHMHRQSALALVARELAALYQSVLAQNAQRLAQSRR
jgi:hypothetical protein